MMQCNSLYEWDFLVFFSLAVEPEMNFLLTLRYFYLSVHTLHTIYGLVAFRHNCV